MPLPATACTREAGSRCRSRLGVGRSDLDDPSRDKPIEALATAVVPEALERCRDARATPIHFVTHSMGGMVVRYYLEQNASPGWDGSSCWSAHPGGRCAARALHMYARLVDLSPGRRHRRPLVALSVATDRFA